MRNLLSAITLAFAVALAASPAPAQDSIKQIPLTEQHIQNFLAAQKEMSAIAAPQGQDGQPAAPDAKLQAQMDAIIKKNGFKDTDEFATVADNISLVMSGIDPETKEFSEPKAAIQKEIEEVSKDSSMSADEKKQALAELNEALKTAEPVKYPGNVELVKKHYTELDKSAGQQ